MIRPLVTETVGDQIPIRLRCWDGSQVEPDTAPVQLRINIRRALRRLLRAPNELSFARAYVSGDIEIDGELWAGLEEVAASQLVDRLYRFIPPEPPAISVRPTEQSLARWRSDHQRPASAAAK